MRIRQLREERQFTQEEIAEVLGNRRIANGKVDTQNLPRMAWRNSLNFMGFHWMRSYMPVTRC